MNQHTINPQTWHHHAWLNRLQSLLLLGFMAAFLALLGYSIWGSSGLFLMLVLGVVMLLFSPQIPASMMMRMYGAQPISPQQAPGLWQAHMELCQRAGLTDIPPLYYVPSRALVAFTAGQRGQAAIALSDGLLRQLNLRQLAGVLGHELSHIRSNDLWVMTLADFISRVTTVLSLAGQLLLLLSLPLLLFGVVIIGLLPLLLLVIAPTVVALAQLALSRTREFDADLNAAALTGDPDGLASALYTIERLQGEWRERFSLLRRERSQPSLLRTHPRTEDRIARLKALKPQREPPSYYSDTAIPMPFSVTVARKPRRRIHGLWY